MAMTSGQNHHDPFPGVFRRGAAYLADCVCVFALFVVTQLIVFTPLRKLLGIDDTWFRNGLHTQLYTLATISVPVWLYFSLFESSRASATPGKRLLRMRVECNRTGTRIGFPRALARTIVKLLPWEAAHLANNLPEPMWYAEDPAFRIGFAVSGVLLVIYVLTVAFAPRRRGPHDMLAGTVVVMTPGRPQSVGLSGVIPGSQKNRTQKAPPDR